MSKDVQQRIESTLAEYAQRLQRVADMSDSVQQALEKFALALAECAEQLRIHTIAIRDLSEVRQQLRHATQEQNKVLSLLKGAITEQLTESQSEGKAAEECVILHVCFLSAFRDGDCN